MLREDLSPTLRYRLPGARGPISERLFVELSTSPHDLAWKPDVDSANEEDVQLALFCCYELHYGGLDGVAAGWEWEPSLLGVRRALEDRFESELRSGLGDAVVEQDDVVASLWALARGGDGPSLSRWMSAHGTLGHFREFCQHRSAYQLKEADPHTWAIPRLRGRAKAVMVAIQADEYGNGAAEAMHCSLFATTMTALGLDATPLAYLDQLPATTLATTNLISLFGLHRRWRGALVGHLALFEMTSAGPMARYAKGLRRLGLPEEAAEFFAVHVRADEVHQHLAANDMVGGLLEDEPDLARDVQFGARALSLVERRFSEHLLDSFEAGRTSLRRPGEP